MTNLPSRELIGRRLARPATNVQLSKAIEHFLEVVPRQLQLSRDELKTAYTVLSGIFLDEIEFDPDARSYPHMWARADTYLKYLHSLYCTRKPEGVTCLYCGRVGEGEPLGPEVSIDEWAENAMRA